MATKSSADGFNSNDGSNFINHHRVSSTTGNGHHISNTSQPPPPPPGFWPPADGLKMAPTSTLPPQTPPPPPPPSQSGNIPPPPATTNHHRPPPTQGKASCVNGGGVEAGGRVDPKWEPDEKEVIKRRIYELKRTFHNGRYLIVRHMPKDTTEQNVRALLSSVLIHSVQFSPSNPNVSSTNSTLNAHVLLAEPELIESWTGKNNNSGHQNNRNNSSSTPKIPNTLTYKGHQITISPSSTENLLCITCLPEDTEEQEFAQLVSTFGAVSYSFLMRSEKTGDSKGYGFVCYISHDVAMQARALLDHRPLRHSILGCEWVEPNIVTFSSLHSCCLLVDGLPRDYRELGEFRKIFSKVANPPYCQIPLCNNSQETWGLVEYATAAEAEETVVALKGLTIHGHKVRMRFCTPGKRAINLYTKFLNDFKQNGRGGPLLPQPPANKIFAQLHNLAKSNPAFADSLRSIILSQIENLKEGSNLPPVPATPPPPTAIPSVPPPPIRMQPPPPPAFHHLISIPPPPQHIRLPPPPLPPCPPHSMASFSALPPNSIPHPVAFNPNAAPPAPPQTGTSDSRPLDDNVRALLALFVSALAQPNLVANNTISELLNNQQLMTTLTSLMNQASSSSNGPASKQHTPSSAGQSNKGPLLPTPNTTADGKSESSNSTDSKPTDSTSSNSSLNPLLSGLLDSVGVNVNGSSDVATTNGHAQGKTGFDSILNDTANLQRLLGVLNPSQGMAPGAAGLGPMQNGFSGVVPPLVSSIGSSLVTSVPNGLTTMAGFNSLPHHQGLGMIHGPPLGTVPNLGIPHMDMFGIPGQAATLLQPPLYQNAPQPPHNTTMSMLLSAANSKPQGPSPALTPASPELLFQQPTLTPVLDPSAFVLPALPAPTQLIGQPPTTSLPSPIGTLHSRMYSPAIYQISSSKPSYTQAPGTLTYSHYPQVSLPTSYTNGVTNYTTGVSMAGAIATSVTASSNGGYTTPTKRKSLSGRMLPSPEPSPEGGYIGQHSQGIGGHYQSSYVSRKKSRKN